MKEQTKLASMASPSASPVFAPAPASDRDAEVEAGSEALLEPEPEHAPVIVTRTVRAMSALPPPLPPSVGLRVQPVSSPPLASPVAAAPPAPARPAIGDFVDVMVGAHAHTLGSLSEPALIFELPWLTHGIRCCFFFFLLLLFFLFLFLSIRTTALKAP